MDMKFKGIRKDVSMKNKSWFLKELQNSLKYSKEECEKIERILENHFILTKHGIEKAREEIKRTLSITEEESKKIMNSCETILKSEIKNKLKHPFKN